MVVRWVERMLCRTYPPSMDGCFCKTAVRFTLFIASIPLALRLQAPRSEA